ncbi:uncharacterized protein DUF2285 [Litoreibacter halocynthiae]|uniref:Uncharacterized protein DUF2285 n=1 Tax=Litoreibacter halocynthiae TaxID=1242689 RepID=A0A4R7LCS7_9RHOB|nr:DUF2285 domain-containing protein [Litoreibacter halocynthiae]TDT73327.1 uncharacterized protein DUF2285 [Litoreibacter halocynthiae]
MPNTNEWGCPSWTDDGGYIGNDTWSETRWRWEFLRRKASVRSTYWLKAYDEWRETVSEAIPERLLFQPKFERLFFDLGPGEAANAGIAPLPNPVYSWGEVWPDETSSRSPLKARSFYHYDVIKTSDDLASLQKLIPIAGIAISFDPNSPIEPQIEGLQEYLESLRHHSVTPLERLHKSKRLLYLRVLDASEQGASYQDIANRLLRHTQKTLGAARDVSAQAKRFRDSV